MAVVVVIVLAVSSLGCSSTSSSGRYFTHRYEDMRDFLTAEAGVGKLWSGGAYFEMTQWLHCGVLYFDGYKVSIDRRATQVLKERSLKLGLGPWQYTRIFEYRVIAGNAYADLVTRAADPDGARYDQLEAFMDAYKPLAFLVGEDTPANRWRFLPGAYGPHYRGWQCWGETGFEVATPGILGSHFIGIPSLSFKFVTDVPSQFEDFMAGLFGVEWYYYDGLFGDKEGLINEQPAEEEEKTDEAMTSAKRNPDSPWWFE